MPNYRKIKFVIDGFTPLTFPIGRLAEYLRQFSALVGPNSEVHFHKVGDGSAALISLVPEEELPSVRGRMISAQRGEGPVEAVGGFTRIRTLLSEDKTAGRVKEERNKIIEFPRLERPQFGPITEEGTIEGVLIKIGGRDESIPAHLHDGARYYKCNTTRTTARSLAPNLFGDPIRVFGRGRWIRTPDGTWQLEHFQITNFETLNGDDLQLVLERMRQVPGSGWDAIKNPLAELERIRKGSNKVQ